MIIICQELEHQLYRANVPLTLEVFPTFLRILKKCTFSPNKPPSLKNIFLLIFSGTSSATPLAAGVGALMLEANPNLTYRDVMYILANSSVKIQSTEAQYFTNRAGYSHSYGYGFGMISAKIAIQRALIWKNVGALEIITGNKVVTGNALTTNNQIVSTTSISGDKLTAEQITVFAFF
jgi:subtilisin family serine protease